MHFHWLTFLVYKDARIKYTCKIQKYFQTIIQTESIQYLHKKFDNSVPQRPEVDKQHCNEVTKRHLVKDDLHIIGILLHLYFCFIHLLQFEIHILQITLHTGGVF